MNQTQSYSGKCLCGTIHYTLTGNSGDIKGITACHCNQCRRWSGQYWASLSGPLSGFTLDKGEENLVWFQSSKLARRGFCKTCGSALLWHGNGYPDLKDKMDVSAGSLEHTGEFKLERHIFCESKGVYYTLNDGVPTFDTH